MSISESALRQGLEQWRLINLQAIEAKMIEFSEDFTGAREDLEIAHRYPGEVAEDVIQIFWAELNRSASGLDRLERLHQKLLEMKLPELIVAFQRSPKRKTWPLGARRMDLGDLLTENQRAELLRLAGQGNQGQHGTSNRLPVFPKTAWVGLFAEYRDLVGSSTEAPDVYHWGVF